MATRWSTFPLRGGLLSLQGWLRLSRRSGLIPGDQDWFIKNSIDPPLPYNDNAFDFIFALSVFTHLSETLQLQWINELRRILRPKGYILISLHGGSYLDQLKTVERERFLAGGLVERNEGSIGSNRFAAYHPQSYVLEILGADLEFVQFLKEGAKGNPHQDLYLFRNK